MYGNKAWAFEKVCIRLNSLASRNKAAGNLFDLVIFVKSRLKQKIHFLRIESFIIPERAKRIESNAAVLQSPFDITI